ncbi:MAG: hypothetical protein ABN482_00110 [Corticimicrobacter sp.]|uniref:hypothetical protein n=1 Tax=Corticimicrobacter sp. TaxID=2678536 RepID=UPI0032DA3A62
MDAAEWRNKKGCLWLMLGGLAFMGLVFGIIIYVISRPQTAEVEAQEWQAILVCRQQLSRPDITPQRREFLGASCREMEKQFRFKFPNATQ